MRNRRHHHHKTRPKPLVSIIIPTRNRSRWLREAVNSVLAQDFGHWELLIVDHASQDDTYRVVERFRKKDRRIRYYRFPDSEKANASSVRNRGLREVRGQYTAFLDDDDVWMPEKLGAQLKVFKDNENAGVVFTDGLSFDENRTLRNAIVPTRNRLFARWMRAHAGSSDVYTGDLLNILIELNPITLSSAMVRTKFLRRIHGFDETVGPGQGYHLWLRIAPHCSFAFLDRKLMRYRITKDSISGVFEERVFRAREVNAGILSRHFSKLPRNLRKAASAKIAENSGLSAWYYLRKNQTRHARKLIGQSLRYRFLQPKLVAFWASSFLPAALRQSLFRWHETVAFNDSFG